MFLADAAAVWSPGALYLYAQPYLLVLFNLGLPIVIGYAVYLLHKCTGIALSQNAQAAIEAATMNAAGRIMASQDQRFATMQIDVKSPLVAKELPVVGDIAKAAIDRLGLSPDHVGAMIAGEVGHLQAQALSVAPATAGAAQ